MDNTRVEQLIKRKNDAMVFIVRTLGILAAIILTFFSLALAGSLGFIIGFFAIYAVYYLIKMTDVEYEYLLMNNELSIDIIYGKERRKHCCQYNVKEAEIFAPIESDRVHNYLHNEKVVAKNYSSGNVDAKIYVLVVNSESVMTKLFIEPNEELFEGIQYYIPRKTYTE